MGPVEEAIARLRAEFREMPGLRLTVGQLRRLCDVDPTLCQAALDFLVVDGFLDVSPDGYYTLLQESHQPHAAARLADVEPSVRRAS